MIFLLTSRNARLKRRVAVVAMIVGGTVLVVPWIFLGVPWFGLSELPFLILVLALVARQVRFCDACGFTNLVRNPMKSDPRCDDCGEPLDLWHRWL